MSHNFFSWTPLIKNQRGSVLSEFIIVFPIVLLLFFTTIELGIMLAIKANMQSCVLAGAAYGATGNYNAGSTPTASAQSAMMSGLSSVVNQSNLTVTIQSYPTFAAASGGGGSSGTGSAGNVSLYKMQYAYSPICPMVAAIFGATHTLTATSYTKNAQSFPS